MSLWSWRDYVLTMCCSVMNSVHVAESFTTAVWRCLVSNVPYGQTVSYRELARLTGRSRASRAVGQAMRRNPVPLLVPCHRVIHSSGQTGHYSAGRRDCLKTWLLMLEKSHKWLEIWGKSHMWWEILVLQWPPIQGLDCLVHRCQNWGEGGVVKGSGSFTFCWRGLSIDGAASLFGRLK